MYSAQVNRARPACLLLLVDQSYSMSEPWSEASMSKAQALAHAVNNIIGTAVVLCSKGDNRIVDYFELGVLGYNSEVTSALVGTSISSPLLPISTLANNPKRIEERPQRMPVWIDPAHSGSTAMVSALTAAEKALIDWCSEHPESFPPIVINLTDGESTDGDPVPVADRIRTLSTNDGAVLLFNLHLSKATGGRISFPSDATGLPDIYASKLFEMSSVLPSSMAEAASSLEYPVEPGARGFLYNADAATVVQFLDIGTRAVTPGGLKQITGGN